MRAVVLYHCMIFVSKSISNGKVIERVEYLLRSSNPKNQFGGVKSLAFSNAEANYIFNTIYVYNLSGVIEQLHVEKQVDEQKKTPVHANVPDEPTVESAEKVKVTLIQAAPTQFEKAQFVLLNQILSDLNFFKDNVLDFISKNPFTDEIQISEKIVI